MQTADIIARVTRRFSDTHLAQSVAYRLGQILGARQRVLVGAMPSGAPIFLSSRDRMHRAIYFFGHYDDEVAGVFDRVVQPGDTVIDIGANVGYFSLYARDLGATVHAFEPNPAMASLLRRSAAGTVVVNELACGDREGWLPLYLASDGDTAISSLHAATDDIDSEAVGVGVLTLDRYVLERNLNPVLVKIDVERHELEVLRGASCVLRDHQPDVLIEISGCPEALDLLIRLGYSAWRITADGLTPLDEIRADDWANVYLSTQPHPRGLTSSHRS